MAEVSGKISCRKRPGKAGHWKEQQESGRRVFDRINSVAIIA
jgi:hypothetical protein